MFSNIEVVLWVDKNNEYKSENIKSVDKIFDVEFDVIIIAVAYEYVADEIKKDLCKKGIDKNKIIWNKPLREII